MVGVVVVVIVVFYLLLTLIAFFLAVYVMHVSMYVCISTLLPLCCS